MSRVIHISFAHTPSDVRIFEKECRSLAEARYDVHYLVPHATHTQNSSVTLHTLPERNIKIRIFFFLILLYDTFKIALKLRGDIYHIHDPILIPVGILLNIKRKVVIYDAHEDAPVEALSLNRSNKLKGLLLSLTWRVLLMFAKIIFDGFIAATPAIALTLPKSKTIVIKNYPCLDRFSNIEKSKIECNAMKTIIYIGSISEIRGIRQMLDAIHLLPDHLNFRFQLIGEFTTESLKYEMMQHPAWIKVDYHSQQPWNAVIEKLSQATIGLVLLHPTPEYLVSLPVKLFEYMAAGIPVIASDFPLWNEIVTLSACGIMVDPLKPQQIANAIEKLLTHPKLCAEMGSLGQKAVNQRYSWESEKANLLAFYQRFAQSKAQ